MHDVELWPGQFTQIESCGQIVMVKCLEKVDVPERSTWKWPVKKDEHDYSIYDFKQKMETPLLPLDG